MKPTTPPLEDLSYLNPPQSRRISEKLKAAQARMTPEERAHQARRNANSGRNNKGKP